MARNRDPFALALDSLQRRTAAGAYHPQRPIVIQEEARRLGLSTTPVREALAWLCGAGLVQRAASGGYLGARLDLAGLRSRYAFRLQCLQLALAAAPVPPGGWGRDRPPETWSSSAALFQRVMAWSGDEVLQEAFQRVGAQLEPVAASEARVLPDRVEEIEEIASCLSRGDTGRLLERLTVYHRRRAELALPLLLDLESRADDLAREP